MLECPIDYYVDNIIFNADKSCWGVYRMVGYDYDFLSLEGKIGMLHKTARFLSGIFSEAQILIIPVAQSMEGNFCKLKAKLNPDDTLYETALYYSEMTQKYLEDTVQARGATNDYKTYIVVSLKSLEEAQDQLNIKGMKRQMDFFLKNPVNAVNFWMNLDTRDIMQNRMQLAVKLAEHWYKEQSIRMELAVPDTEEVQWLFKRIAYRGLNRNPELFYDSTDKRKKWSPKHEKKRMGTEEVIRPLKRDIVNLFNGTVQVKNRVVSVTTDDSISYQTFLVITHIPDEIEFPGMEWIYHLQENDMQAEICIHIRAIEYRQGLKKIDMQKRELGSQAQHESESEGNPSEELLDGSEYANLLEAELKNSKAPILNTSVTICLASGSLELLEEKAAIVKNDYVDMHFGIERPLTDQKNLFMQCIPSVNLYIKDFVMPMTPRSLAGGIIGATHDLGNQAAPYIGTTGFEEKHIFLDLGIACLQNKSASATFYGDLGYGKSFNANLLVLLTVIYGGYALIFDPKGERTHWEKELKILDGLITTVMLSADWKYQGKLDPYNIYKDNISEANELAINMITELFKIRSTDNAYTALLEAARLLKIKQEAGGTPSMKALAETLKSIPKEDELSEIGRMLARKILLEQENGMSKLLIGDGTEEALDFNNRMNIIQIQNMKLPSPDTMKDDYTAEEMRSSVVMMVLSHFAKKFALKAGPAFKVILFDESWMLGKTAEGVKLYDFLTRMGRSLYSGCIFNGHSVLDLPTEAIKNTITYKFCFHTGNDSEADRMLAYLDIEKTKENREVLKGLRNAECLFKDLNGRVGILKFDAVFQDIINVFKTTPKAEIVQKKAEEIFEELSVYKTEAEMQEDVPETQDQEFSDPEEGAQTADWFCPPVPELDLFQREVI